MREQNASLVEPVDVANSSQSTRDEGSMSRNQAELGFFQFRERSIHILIAASKQPVHTFQ